VDDVLREGELKTFLKRLCVLGTDYLQNPLRVEKIKEEFIIKIVF
jgi:hypothetical protein